MKCDFHVMQDPLAEMKIPVQPSESPLQEMIMSVISKISFRFLQNVFRNICYLWLCPCPIHPPQLWVVSNSCETPKASIVITPISFDSEYHKWWLCSLQKSMEKKKQDKRNKRRSFVSYCTFFSFSSYCNKVFLKDPFYWFGFIIVHDSIHLVRDD